MAAVAVIGAGIIGLSVAANLQRLGLTTTIFDALPPGSSTSYGNAGMISVAAVTPMAMPGMLREIPRWLADPQGPLFVQPRYLPSALPWLLRWVRAGAMSEVRRAARGLWALHRHALEEYRDLLGEAFSDLIQTSGQIHIWDSAKPSASERIAAQLREELGVSAQSLSATQLREMAPDLTPDISRALYFPQNGHTVNPLRLAQTIAQLFCAAGGRIVSEQCLRIVPEGSRYRLWTHCGDHYFDQVVVAAGAWSRTLLKPLGVRLPLETERGYHVQFLADGPSGQISVPIPLLHKGRGFGASAMETGLRVAGTVEIAGLERPPDPRRIEALVANAKRLLPRLDTRNYKIWMGYRPSTPDSLPVLSALARHPGLYMAGGHGHTGVTAAAVSGRLVAQLVAQHLAGQGTGVAPFIDPSPYRLERFS